MPVVFLYKQNETIFVVANIFLQKILDNDVVLCYNLNRRGGMPSLYLLFVFFDVRTRRSIKGRRLSFLQGRFGDELKRLFCLCAFI